MAVKITREGGANGLPTKTRGDVRPGEVFQVLDKNGRAKGPRYAHLGSNGKKYSVNLTNGEFASTKNQKSRVQVVGKFTYAVNRDALPTRTTRGKVKDGQIFTVGNEPGSMYLAIGRKGKYNEGDYFSVNLVSGDVAATGNGNSAVNVIGSGSIKADTV